MAASVDVMTFNVASSKEGKFSAGFFQVRGLSLAKDIALGCSSARVNTPRAENQRYLLQRNQFSSSTYIFISVCSNHLWHKYCKWKQSIWLSFQAIFWKNFSFLNGWSEWIERKKSPESLRKTSILCSRDQKGIAALNSIKNWTEKVACL